MGEVYFNKFREKKGLVLLDIEATKVYEEVAKEILENSESEDFQNNRDLLYKKLEEKFDNSSDDFERLVIAYSFITGIYFIRSGLNTQGALDVYKGSDGKRFKEFSNVAIDSAFKLCNQLIEQKTQYRLCKELIDLGLAVSDTTHKEKIKNAILKYVEDIEIDKNDEKLAVFQFEFLVPAVGYLLDSKEYKEKKELSSKIDNLLKFAKGQGDTAKSTRSKYNEMNFDCIFPCAFELKIKYYQKMNDKENEKKTKLDFGKFYEELGSKRLSLNTGADVQVAEYHFENAVKTLAQTNFKEELNQAKQKLDEIRKKIEETRNERVFATVTNLENDSLKELKKQEEKFIQEFSKLSFDNKLFNLIQMVQFITPEQIREFRKQSKSQNQFSEVFIIEIKNSKNQTIFMDDTEESKESFALYNYIQFYMVTISPFIQTIISEVTEGPNNKIEFRIEGLNFILKEREHLINKAFELFLSGDIYSGLHILIPQVEYWFREETYRRGGQISNLKNFPMEQAKTMIPVLDLEESKQFLGEELHWLFEQLMTKEPLNLRNKIAHGLDLNDNGYCAYFCLIILKLMIKQPIK